MAIAVEYYSKQHDQAEFDLSKIETIFTLGPMGTNCEAAATEWFRRQNRQGEVVLYPTLEDALEKMPHDKKHALLSCVAYPELHTLVFSNLQKIKLAECFVFPTFNMVYASKNGLEPKTVATHSAPQYLVPIDVEKIYVSSNAQAAADCAAEKADGCITTLPAAQQHNLKILKDYGPVPMGFAIHASHFGGRKIQDEEKAADNFQLDHLVGINHPTASDGIFNAVDF